MSCETCIVEAVLFKYAQTRSRVFLSTPVVGPPRGLPREQSLKKIVQRNKFLEVPQTGRLRSALA